MAKTTKKATKEEQSGEATAPVMDICIPPINTKILTVRIIGDTPLLVHAWDRKAIQMMLDKQLKKASAGKAAKDPFADFVGSLYWLTGKPDISDFSEEERALAASGEPVNIGLFADAKFGFPTSGFKASAIDAGFQQNILGKKTTARGAIHILGEYAVIEGFPTMRQDMVRIGGGNKSTADIRFRGEFQEWSTFLTIRYNANAISPEQIVCLLNYGGFANGVGEWRPGKGDSHGTYHVAEE